MWCIFHIFHLDKISSTCIYSAFLAKVDCSSCNLFNSLLIYTSCCYSYLEFVLLGCFILFVIILKAPQAKTTQEIREKLYSKGLFCSKLESNFIIYYINIKIITYESWFIYTIFYLKYIIAQLSTYEFTSFYHLFSFPQSNQFIF